MEGLKIVYAQTPFPTQVTKTLFLAGPTARGNRPTAWRQEALQILKDIGFDGHVFIPEAEGGKWNGDTDAQNAWEHAALTRADAIVFWVIRDLDTMPGFTTNIEFGQWMRSGKIVLGIPEGAPATSYMRWCAETYRIPFTDDLKFALRLAREHLIGKGDLREGDDVLLSLQEWRKKQYAKIAYPKPDLTADMVVVHEGDVLLIKRKKEPFKDQWALPGGYVNKGETTKAAAARELLEEAGIVAKDLHYVGVFDDPDRDPRGWIVSHAYSCFDATSRDIQAGDDAAEAKWFPMPEAEAMTLAFDHNKILEKALSDMVKYDLPLTNDDT